MRCARCGLLNPDTVLRCTGCGAVLASRECASSAADETDPQDDYVVSRESVRRLLRYVPAVVAEAILHDQERLRGERREVAVLFADAVNFTHLATSLDAESVFNLINDLLSRLVACIHRYDGMVDKFTGDGLMAIFGAPIAHENDSELAVRAALDMQEAAAEFESIAFAQLGAPLQIRTGIHTGLAVAGIIGTQEQAAYTVIGETVNLAARLEALARPGHTLVSERVYRQTRELFNFQAMGTTQIKGINQPVSVYEAIGERSEPLPTRGVAGVTDIFLGRDAELEQLRAVWTAFLDDQRGRLVTIQGEAGMGKSRLVSEVLSSLPDERVAIWQGHGLPYAQGVRYGVFRSLLQDALDAADVDRGPSARPSGSMSADAYPPDAIWDAYVPPALRSFLHHMLEMELAEEERTILRSLEPERVKQLTILAMREWILGEARQGPVVLILDDFHWADDLSRDMLQSLVNLIYEGPVLLCVMTRPRTMEREATRPRTMEREATRPQPQAPLELPSPLSEQSLAAPLCLTLELKPLPPEHSQALLAHLVDLEGMPEPLVDKILTRAEGNPFYIEEFVRMLIGKDVLTLGDGRWRVASAVALQTLEIPTTLRGLMMARVDRLPEDLQDVLRSAAVVGLQFSARLLEKIERRLHGPVGVLPPLERLTDLGLLEERPQAGEQVYAFRHILTQEAVYRGLLRSQRPGLHRTVAECIEDLYAADLDGQAEVLALHYDRARVRDKALHYALLAGDRACERFANREAIEYYSRALQLSQHLGACQVERWRAAVGLGQVEQHIGEYEESVACYQAALEEYDGATPEERAGVMLRLGQVSEKRGELQEAEGWLHRALAQVSDAGATALTLRAQIYSELGWLGLRRGDLAAAQEQLEQALALVSDSEHYNVLSSILNRLGAVHYNRGQWGEAAERVKRALELRDRLGDIVGYARSLNNLGILKQASGDWDGALADYERAAELHERIGEVEGLALAHANLGVIYTDRGEWARAEENLQRSLTIAQRIAHPYQLALAHLNLGRLHLLREQWAECTQHLDTAVSLYQEIGARAHLNLNDTYWVRGLLHLAQGQVEAAQEWAERSHELLQEVTGTDEGDSVEWGRYEQLMGRIAHTRGDLEAARRHLRRSAVIFQASGSQIEAGRTAYWSGLLWWALDRPEKAREKLVAARQIFEPLGAAADLRRVDEQLAQFEGLSD